jgi:hypothetical protein
MIENPSVITAIGGMDDGKMMVELVKLLQAQYMACPGTPKQSGGSQSSALLSIRESDLTETERLALAYLYGKHIGAMASLDLSEIHKAREYLSAMASLVMTPIEEVERGYANLRGNP